MSASSRSTVRPARCFRRGRSPPRMTIEKCPGSAIRSASCGANGKIIANTTPAAPAEAMPSPNMTSGESRHVDADGHGGIADPAPWREWRGRPARGEEQPRTRGEQCRANAPAITFDRGDENRAELQRRIAIGGGDHARVCGPEYGADDSRSKPSARTSRPGPGPARRAPCGRS